MSTHHSLSRLRAAFLMGHDMRLFIVFGLFLSFSSFVHAGEVVSSESVAWSKCQASVSLRGKGETHCVKDSDGNSIEMRFIETGYRLNFWKFPAGTDCPNGSDGTGCIDPEPQCPTDVIPGAPVMNSSGGADVNVGAASGIYDVDGCAYACYVNTGKFDGNTPYSETLECTGMGKPTDEVTGDEPDPAPENCVLDPTTGKQYCANGDPENPTIETPDGETVEVDDNSICGVQNGTFGCVDFQEEGCGQFNGKKVCYDPDGQKVEPDSPDHPDNGGNLDGDPTNDVNDPRPESEGGDPNNQPGDTTGEGDGATEGTAREQLGELRQIDDKLKGIEQEMKDANKANEGKGDQIKNGVESDLDKAGDSALKGLDEFAEDISEPSPIDSDDLSGVEDSVNSLFDGNSSCQDLYLGVEGKGMSIECQSIQKIRDVLGWIFYALTVLRLFEVVVRSPTKGTH